jgi:Zn-dependent M28 family amino/carboxypeptidase
VARLSANEIALRQELHTDVATLAGEIGERNMWHFDRLAAAADFVETSLARARLQTRRQSYELNGRTCHNIEAEIRGASAQIVVVGAHYDSVIGCPGANDNGSGVAATLALARRFARRSTSLTLRFVGFVNEEPPYFLTQQMGSLVYARGCRQRGDHIAAMISLETIGYFSDAPHSQTYPLPGFGAFYPKTANFIGFVANTSSRALLRRVVSTFRQQNKIPAETAALPQFIPGVGWSDHWSFWQCGYPALMVTDTAPFRYPHYHLPTDTPDKLDYDRFTLVVSGMEKVIADLAGRPANRSRLSAAT